MSTCGSCGGVIGSDFWAGTACACAPTRMRVWASVHEALLNGWPFTFLPRRGPTQIMEMAPEITAAMAAIFAVERTPFPDDFVIWLEHPEEDIRETLRRLIDATERPLTLEEMKSSRENYDRRLGEAYKLQAAHYALDEKVFVSTPLPDKHRYGPHATDPYAPGNRRRRR